MRIAKPKSCRWTVVFLLASVYILLSCIQVKAADTKNSFYLTASTSGKTLIEPTVVPYKDGQTVMEALLETEYEFAGLEDGYITSIGGVEGNYIIFTDDGGYNLERPASEVQTLAFTEKEVYSQNMIKLIIRMGEYRLMENHVQNYDAAASAYASALKGLRSAGSEEAGTLLTALNQAISEYEALLDGEKYTVSFTVTQDGASKTDAVITMTDAYGNVTQKTGSSIEVIAGSYQFVVSDGGYNRTEGTLEVDKEEAVLVQLPSGEWFGDVQILNASKEAYESETNTHQGIFYIPDTSSYNSTYLYAEQGADILDSGTTKLRTIYINTNGSDTSSTSRSWSSKTTSMAYLLNIGMEGREFTLEASYIGEDGYCMVQSYGVTICRVPTLRSLDILDDAGTSLLYDFDSDILEYSIQAVSSSLHIQAESYGQDGYSVSATLNQKAVEDDFTISESADNRLLVTVSYTGGESRTYALLITKMEAVTVEIEGTKDGITYVIQNEVDNIIESEDGIHYALIPGDTYHYVTTENGFFHTTEEFIAKDGLAVTLKTPDTEDKMSAFGLFSSMNSSNQKVYEPDTPFTAENHSYTYVVSDANSSVYAKATVPDGYAVYATYLKQHTSESVDGTSVTKEITYAYEASGATALGQLVIRGGYSNQISVRVTKTVNGVEYYQTYEITLARSLHLYDLSVSDGYDVLSMENEEGAVISYDRDVTDYYLSVDTSLEQLALSGTLMNTAATSASCGGYYLDINGTRYEDLDAATVLLDLEAQQENIEITVYHADASGVPVTYTLHVKKTQPVEVSFLTTPKDAIVYVVNQSTGKVLDKTDGCYLISPGQKYSYTVSLNGYVAEKVTNYIAPEQSVQLEINLDKAEENEDLKDLSAYWPYFRYDTDNNGVVDAATPITDEDAVLYWSTRLGEGYSSNACGCPILVDGYLYTYAADKIYKVDTVSGEIIAEGTMDHSSSFAINSPLYADGMIFVGLSGGTVQAFNADTLESLWIYEDELGGQPDSPIVYYDGYIYTGFWLGETSKADFVCLSVTDEDPTRGDEKKLATWCYTRKGGFYWAGACIRDDCLLVGTDDGESGYTSGYGHILSMDPKSGKALDDITLPYTGDVRSSVSYDEETERYYFTSKGGYFYSVSVEDDGTFTENSLKYIQLYNYAQDASNPAMSTSTPVVYNGRAYIGVSGTSQFGAYSGHNITVLDLKDWEIAYTVRTMGYPQTSGLLTTAYLEETEEVYVYFFDNYTPGKLRMLSDSPGQTEAKLVTQENGMDTAYVLFTPDGEQAEYAICSPIVDEYGTIYFKNDSACLMALGSTIEKLNIVSRPENLTYTEGQTFDGTGMKVEAVYSNGTTRDVTDYVTWSKDPLTMDDTKFQIRFEHVMYQNRDGAVGVNYTAPMAVLNLTITEGIKYGDVNLDGAVTVKDATLLYQYLNGQQEFGEKQKERADVNQDGVIDDADVTALYQKIKEK